MTPLVSVCLPVLNGGAHLAQAVASVLAQTRARLELVVGDDGSTDGSRELLARLAAQDPRVRLLPDAPARGAAANWNRCVDAARGELVKVIGQDDLLRPDCLERQVQALAGAPEAAFAVCARDVVDDRGRVLLRGRPPLAGRTGVVPLDEALQAVVRSGTNPLGEPVSVLLRATTVRAVGGFDDRLPYVVDLDHWCRALEHGPVVVQPDTLCSWRVSAGSWSRALASAQAGQAGQLFADLAARHPELLPPALVRAGKRRARVLALLRRGVYAGLAVRTALTSGR